VEVSIQEVGRPGGAAICITTMDEGKGVPSESVKQIFDPFFRVPSEGSHRQGGAGLGLSISKRVVTLYGGNIEAHNLPEGGLAVSLTFPTTGSHP
jgi:two-component system sensor histidine kinase CpxA